MENSALIFENNKNCDSSRMNREIQLPEGLELRRSISYELDPAPKSHYHTAQSLKFAIQAKTFIQQIQWKPNRKNNDKENMNNRDGKKRVICFPFWTILKHRQGRTRSTIDKKLVHPQSEEVFYELIGESLIMKDYHIRSIGNELPARAVGFPWKLQFGTYRDGYSLHNLYRKLHKLDSAVLLLVEDIHGRVFGGLSSCTIKVSDHFFGTSECFLFSFYPEFTIYKWNGDNFYFVQASEDSLAFGSGLGKPGLWLDSDLNKGTTEKCMTYGNQPLIPESDFIIKNLECWTFG